MNLQFFDFREHLVFFVVPIFRSENAEPRARCEKMEILTSSSFDLSYEASRIAHVHHTPLARHEVEITGTSFSSM
jgi:hypothetical protein